MKVPEGKILIQFDGICVLCSRTVRHILKADRKNKFIFQTLQSASGKLHPETIIVLDQNKSYMYFDAVLKIAQELGGIYRLAAIFRILPHRWRLSLYLWIAKNRYRWFGMRETCYIPSEKEKEKFI